MADSSCPAYLERFENIGHFMRGLGHIIRQVLVSHKLEEILRSSACLTDDRDALSTDQHDFCNVERDVGSYRFCTMELFLLGFQGIGLGRGLCLGPRLGLSGLGVGLRPRDGLGPALLRALLVVRGLKGPGRELGDRPPTGRHRVTATSF